MWEAVHVAKLGAWALLVTMSFVLVATVKAQEGRLYAVPAVSAAQPADTLTPGDGPPPASGSRSGPHPPARR